MTRDRYGDAAQDKQPSPLWWLALCVTRRMRPDVRGALALGHQLRRLGVPAAMIRKFAVMVLALAVSTITAGSAQASGTPVSPAGVVVYGHPVCGTSWVPIDMGHGRYFNAYNDVSNGSTCIVVNQPGRLAYHVTYEKHTAPHYWLMTNISEGIHWGRYTCNDGPSGTSAGTWCARFPVEVYKEGSITASAIITPPPYGRYDIGWDIWFDKHYIAPALQRQANGTEIMIRMCDRQIAITPYKTAHIDGHTWLVEHWNTWGNGTTWRYVAYVSPTCGTHTWKLNLSHIFMDAVRAGDLKLTYYLVEIPFGPETYSGGAGFGLHYYDVEGVR